jgi:hypothetical protein
MAERSAPPWRWWGACAACAWEHSAVGARPPSQRVACLNPLVPGHGAARCALPGAAAPACPTGGRAAGGRGGRGAGPGGGHRRAAVLHQPRRARRRAPGGAAPAQPPDVQGDRRVPERGAAPAAPARAPPPRAQPGAASVGDLLGQAAARAPAAAGRRAGVRRVQEEIKAIRQPRWTDRRCAIAAQAACCLVAHCACCEVRTDANRLPRGRREFQDDD